MKTNRVVLPNYCVNQACNSAPLDTPVCWDGLTEQVLPGGTLSACDANGMQNVYMLTSLAVTPGLRDNSARRLLRSEVAAPSIRPPGAITMDAAGISASLSDSSNSFPVFPERLWMGGRINSMAPSPAAMPARRWLLWQLTALPPVRNCRISG